MQLATIWGVDDLKRDTWHLLSPSNFHISSYKEKKNTMKLTVDFCGHSCLVHISPPQLMRLALLGVSNWSALILRWPRGHSAYMWITHWWLHNYLKSFAHLDSTCRRTATSKTSCQRKGLLMSLRPSYIFF